jgi:hypothetical protein
MHKWINEKKKQKLEVELSYPMTGYISKGKERCVEELCALPYGSTITVAKIGKQLKCPPMWMGKDNVVFMYQGIRYSLEKAGGIYITWNKPSTAYLTHMEGKKVDLIEVGKTVVTKGWGGDRGDGER